MQFSIIKAEVDVTRPEKTDQIEGPLLHKSYIEIRQIKGKMNRFQENFMNFKPYLGLKSKYVL